MSSKENDDIKLKAIDLWLSKAVSDILARNFSQATKWLEKAHRKTSFLSSSSMRRKLEIDHSAILSHIHMCEFLCPVRPPQPSTLRFQVYSANTVNQTVYDCLFGLSRLIRKLVFVDEMKIPAYIEFDDHDKEAIHAHVLKGDALFSYSRSWICQGFDRSGARWAVLDRICTINNQLGSSSRRKGIGSFMIHNVARYLNDLVGQSNISILVLHIPTTASPLLFSKLKQGGLQFVLEQDLQVLHESEKKKKLDIVFWENDHRKPRINWIAMWTALPNADQSNTLIDLKEIREYYQRYRAQPKHNENRGYLTNNLASTVC